MRSFRKAFPVIPNPRDLVCSGLSFSNLIDSVVRLFDGKPVDVVEPRTLSRINCNFCSELNKSKSSIYSLIDPYGHRNASCFSGEQPISSGVQAKTSVPSLMTLCIDTNCELIHRAFNEMVEDIVLQLRNQKARGGKERENSTDQYELSYEKLAGFIGLYFRYYTQISSSESHLLAFVFRHTLEYLHNKKAGEQMLIWSTFALSKEVFVGADDPSPMDCMLKQGSDPQADKVKMVNDLLTERNCEALYPYILSIIQLAILSNAEHLFDDLNSCDLAGLRNLRELHYNYIESQQEKLCSLHQFPQLATWLDGFNLRIQVAVVTALLSEYNTSSALMQEHAIESFREVVKKVSLYDSNSEPTAFQTIELNQHVRRMLIEMTKLEPVAWYRLLRKRPREQVMFLLRIAHELRQEAEASESDLLPKFQALVDYLQ